MGKPGIRKVLGGLRMAGLTADKKVLLHLETSFGIVGPLNIMHTVAVEANCLIGFGIWSLFIENSHRCAMKIRYISFRNLSGNAIFRHKLGVAMALGANLW